MSGGAYDYAYQGILDLAEEIRQHAPEYAASSGLEVEDVAAAACALEWLDSGDTGVEETKRVLTRVCG